MGIEQRILSQSHMMKNEPELFINILKLGDEKRDHAFQMYENMYVQLEKIKHEKLKEINHYIIPTNTRHFGYKNKP